MGSMRKPRIFHRLRRNRREEWASYGGGELRNRCVKPIPNFWKAQPTHALPFVVPAAEHL